VAVPLDCSIIVFRSITRRRDIRDGLATAMAFKRRPFPKDGDGLSVEYNRQPSDCGQHLNGVKLVVSLQTGHIREIVPRLELGDPPLDVVPDCPTHAAITNVTREEVNPERCEQIATALASHSRAAWSSQ